MPTQRVHNARRPLNQLGPKTKTTDMRSRKPQLSFDDDDGADDPSQWLGFSLPPRSTNNRFAAPPRRSKKGDAWRGSVMTREKFVNASFRFVLKPTDVLSYGAHCVDPDIALHWPNILQILVPTFSSYSVAQGFVSSENDEDEDLAGEEAAERRRRVEEEKEGRSCPICLSKPVAGRMTKCGHIFCFPCILHYIALSDVPKASSCPICGDTIHEGMLKSVRYLDAETMVKAAQGDGGGSYVHPEVARTLAEAKNIDGEPQTAGSSHRIHMRLLQRPQMSTLAFPKSATWPSDAISPASAPWHFLPDVLAYSRFSLATPEYMMHELERELGELDNELKLLGNDSLGRGFVQTAKEKIERQMGKVRNELMTDLVRRDEAKARHAWGEAQGGHRRQMELQQEREQRALEQELQQQQQQEADDKDLNVPTHLLDTTRTAYDTPTVRVPPNVVVPPNPMPEGMSKKARQRRIKSQVNQGPSIAPGPAQFFYQSSLGANVFLSPLDQAILLKHFGGTEANLPSHISFPVTAYNSVTVSDEVRKTVKYLKHLPGGSEVMFVEADLKDIVSKETLAQFEQSLKTRRDKRRARTKREDRDKRRWEEAEKAKLPPEPHYVPSACAPVTTGNGDADLALALERSRLDTENASAFPTMGSSPPTRSAQAASSPAPASSSFASALRSAPGQRPARNDVHSADLEGIWGSIDGAWGSVDDQPTGKKKGKKGKKLVLGGGGRQA